jgi:hypothetical protein
LLLIEIFELPTDPKKASNTELLSPFNSTLTPHRLSSNLSYVLSKDTERGRTLREQRVNKLKGDQTLIINNLTFQRDLINGKVSRQVMNKTYSTESRRINQPDTPRQQFVSQAKLQDQTRNVQRQPRTETGQPFDSSPSASVHVAPEADPRPEFLNLYIRKIAKELVLLMNDKFSGAHRDILMRLFTKNPDRFEYFEKLEIEDKDRWRKELFSEIQPSNKKS